MAPATDPHRWKFFRAGGVDQVDLRDGADIAALGELDPKLWVALAMPTTGVAIDRRTMAFLDSDGDQRVRWPEVLAAVRWLREVLVDVGTVMKGGDTLPLSALREGPVKTAARWILSSLGKPDETTIGLADAEKVSVTFAASAFNGDGIMPADSAEDPAIRQVLEDIAATKGTVPDRSGKPGVDRPRIDAFFAEARALLEWRRAAAGDERIHPLGEEATARAAGAVGAIRAKVDDYFVRCRLAAFTGADGALRPEELASLSGKDLDRSTPELVRLPLARIAPGVPLPLDGEINPAWADAARQLGDAALTPILGARTSLTESDWGRVTSTLAAHVEWMSKKPATQVAGLGWKKLEAVAQGGAEASVRALVDQDVALDERHRQIEEVSKLLHLQRDFFVLLKNFVNFADFYRRVGAAFQAGHLYLDGRTCDLCLEVTDPGRYGSLAASAGMYLAHCALTRPGGETKNIVAAFTDGDSDNLFVGRNGVFFDRAGRDWDATITSVISNPISLREAFWSPYKKVVRMVEDGVAKRAAAREAASDSKLAGAAVTVAHADIAKPPDLKKIDVGTIAAIGVAVGGIGAMIVGLFSAFTNLGVWMPVGVVAIVLAISGPSMVLAWLKLRRRNLGPLLDANGWAINGRARLNVPFGGSLTALAKLPPGSQRSLDDPYAEKRRPWKAYAAVALAVLLGVAWLFGRLDRYLPHVARSVTVLGKYAPAALAPAPPESGAPESGAPASGAPASGAPASGAPAGGAPLPPK